MNCVWWMGLTAVFSATGPSEEAPVSAQQAIALAHVSHSSQSLAQEFVLANHWRKRNEIGKQLAACGHDAVPLCLEIIHETNDSRLSFDAFELLCDHFPQHLGTVDFVLTEGLTHQSPRIVYRSLWFVGEQQLKAARPQLITHLKNPTHTLLLRAIAAKSLADCGDASGLRTLIEAAQNDFYMPRYAASQGLKSLTGKNLNDFAGYNFGEGAFVSGGVEARILNPDPASVARTKAGRWTALVKYLEWLQVHRPDLYNSLVTDF